MTRVALYARYSLDQQSESLIEGQFRLCREQAKRDGLKVIGTYHGGDLWREYHSSPGYSDLAAGCPVWPI